MPFTTRVRVHFYHADSAGVMFFGNLYRLAHQVFEAFIVAAGFGWDEWFSNPAWLVPFRRVEADYLRPMRPGRDYEGRLSVERIGDTSFTVCIQFLEESGEPVSELRMVVVFADRGTEQKIPVPADVRERLIPFVE
jgi:1,4-dihydroxy-2-naphthoyl-CoA hydrolase